MTAKLTTRHSGQSPWTPPPSPRDASAVCWSTRAISRPSDLQSALEQQQQEGRNKLLGEILVELEYCTEDQVVECLAAEYGVPYAKLDARLFDPKIVDVLPREYVEKNLVLPLFLVRGVLTSPSPSRRTCS